MQMRNKTLDHSNENFKGDFKDKSDMKIKSLLRAAAPYPPTIPVQVVWGPALDGWLWCLNRRIVRGYSSNSTCVLFLGLMTCLGRAGSPPYHWWRAFHRESGTSSKSRHLTSTKFFLSFPPSPVRERTLWVGVATSPELSIAPGFWGILWLIVYRRLGLGEWLGLEVPLKTCTKNDYVLQLQRVSVETNFITTQRRFSTWKHKPGTVQCQMS